MQKELKSLPLAEKIYPSDANFVLLKTPDANGIYKYLTDKGVIVRNRNNVSLSLGCLRITVGTKEENETLINTLKNYK